METDSTPSWYVNVSSLQGAVEIGRGRLRDRVVFVSGQVDSGCLRQDEGAQCVERLVKKYVRPLSESERLGLHFRRLYPTHCTCLTHGFSCVPLESC